MEMTKVEMEAVKNLTEHANQSADALIELNALELLLVGGGAGDNPVVVGRKALRLHESFAPAIGATGEIRVLGSGAIKRSNHGLRLFRHFVDAAVTEVDDFLGVCGGPRGIGSLAGVTGVGCGAGIASAHGACQRTVINRSGEAAVALPLIFSIPS